MAGRPIQGGDDMLSRADCNGCVPRINPQGQRIYRLLGAAHCPWERNKWNAEVWNLRAGGFQYKNPKKC